MGRTRDNTESRESRGKGYTYATGKHTGGRTSDNTESGDRGYMQQGGKHQVGGLATIQKAGVDDMRSKGAHRVEDSRQHKERRQRLYATRGHTG